MSSIDVGVRHYDHLVVAEGGEVKVSALDAEAKSAYEALEFGVLVDSVGAVCGGEGPNEN